MIFRYISLLRKMMKKLILILTLNIYVLADSGIKLPANFTANFTQMITNTKKKTIRYAGKVYFSNKTNFKWMYTKPTKKELCVDNTDVVVVDHDLEQVSYFLINKGFNFVKIIKEAKVYKKNIYFAVVDGIRYTIKVDSKKRLHSFAFFDNLDNKVQLVLKKLKYGKGKINKKKMTCKVPKEYDVIRG